MPRPSSSSPANGRTATTTPRRFRFIKKSSLSTRRASPGRYTQEYTKVTVPYTEFAEFSGRDIGRERPEAGHGADAGTSSRNIPRAKLIKHAYSRMGYYYGYQAPKEEAAKFFEEYAGKFPEDPAVLSSWLARIVRDKEPLDKGVELAEKIQTLTPQHSRSDLPEHRRALHPQGR